LAAESKRQKKLGNGGRHGRRFRGSKGSLRIVLKRAHGKERAGKGSAFGSTNLFACGGGLLTRFEKEGDNSKIFRLVSSLEVKVEGGLKVLWQ
jgi:hypothetical protein